MENELALRTVKDLGVTPDYVLQPHAISRSIYDLSTTAKKLTMMAMSILPSDLSIRTVRFKIPEFIKAFDLDRGGNTRLSIKQAVKECVGNAITIESGGNWEMFTWFSHSDYNAKTDEITMTFNEVLAKYLLELKKMYKRLDLADFGKLSSRYAMRFYELAMSYSSLAGKNGNRTGEWYFEKELADIRKLFVIDREKYKLTKDFRKRVIDDPIKEINRAGIGIEIIPQYMREGKFLTGIHFLCKFANRIPSNPELPFEDEEDPEEKAFKVLRKMYPEEYRQYFDEERAKPKPFLHSEERLDKSADYVACKKLLELHGFRK